MFVREELRLQAGFPQARARLADLARSGSLLTAAQAANGDVAAGLARVGPLGPIRWLSRVVQVRFQDVVTRDDCAELVLRWEAAGPGGGLFPALDADITLAPADDDEATLLVLAGVYRPPLGTVGAGLDQAVLHRVAVATIHDFLGRVGNSISAASAPIAAEPAGSGD